jgi:hypothetical protein
MNIDNFKFFIYIWFYLIITFLILFITATFSNKSLYILLITILSILGLIIIYIYYITKSSDNFYMFGKSSWKIFNFSFFNSKDIIDNSIFDDIDKLNDNITPLPEVLPVSSSIQNRNMDFVSFDQKLNELIEQRQMNDESFYMSQNPEGSNQGNYNSDISISPSSTTSSSSSSSSHSSTQLYYNEIIKEIRKNKQEKIQEVIENKEEYDYDSIKERWLIENIYKAFNKLDKDNDNKLNIYELYKMYQIFILSELKNVENQDTSSNYDLWLYHNSGIENNELSKTEFYNLYMSKFYINSDKYNSIKKIIEDYISMDNQDDGDENSDFKGSYSAPLGIYKTCTEHSECEYCGGQCGSTSGYCYNYNGNCLK